MIKSPASHFKLNKASKKLLATILDPHHRGFVKRMEIAAQQAETAAKNARFKKDSEAKK
jgi:hypothetical protein